MAYNMDNYIYNQRVLSGNYDINVNYFKFYRMMWELNPELMFELESSADFDDTSLEDLYRYAHSKLSNNPSVMQKCWVSFALVHIFKSEPNLYLGC